MFKWDGSDISHILNMDKIIITQTEWDKLSIWQIYNSVENITVYCIVRTAKNSLACLIDEIKPIFFLEKIGTHWAKFNGKIYILLKAQIKEDIIIEETTLNEIKIKEPYNLANFLYEVQKIFVFRELLGITKTYESSIVLRNKITHIQPISYYEPNMKPETEKKILPQTVLERWFIHVHTDVDQITKQILCIDKLEDITKNLHFLKEKLVCIVNRVDISMNTSVDLILSRIRNRLQCILK